MTYSIITSGGNADGRRKRFIMLDISAESVYKAISRARNILLQKQGDMKND